MSSYFSFREKQKNLHAEKLQGQFLVDSEKTGKKDECSIDTSKLLEFEN